METAETASERDGLRERITAAYAPYVALCRLLEHRVREQPEDHPPVGWAPYLEALRALRDQTVAGDWTRLAQLMVDPAALPDPAGKSPDPITAALQTPHAHLIDVPAAERRDDTLRTLIDRLTQAGRRVLLLAPDEPTRAALVEALDHLPGLRQAEALPTGPPPSPEPASPDATRVDVPPTSTGPHPPGPPIAESDAPGAGPGVAASGPAAAGTGPRATSPGPSAADARSGLAGTGPWGVGVGVGAERVVRGAVLRAAGSGFEQAWGAESRELRRGLLWLEQWPRDRATVAAVRADAEEAGRRRAELARQVAAAVVAAAEALERAERDVAAAHEDAERLGGELQEAEEAAARLRAELRDRQADADTAAQAAAAGTAAAEAAQGRLTGLTDAQSRCEHELEAARQREAFLREELPRAREALPEATAEATRLMEVTTAADADGHASYYRLAATESALAAEKRQQTFAQRLRVAPASPETQDMRRQVTQRRREADEAARRAKEAREAYEKAEAYRTAVAEVIASGEQELIAVAEAQERHEADLVRLSEEVAAARAEYEEYAQLAALAVDQANRTADAARQAGALSHQADEHAAAVRAAHDAARQAAEQADAAVVAAAQARADAESAKERAGSEAVAAADRERAEIEAAEQAEAGSRGHVADFCATEELDDAVLAAHRDRAMARIDELAAEPTPEVLLAQASVVCATPLALAACAALHDTVFDTLVAADTGRLTDGEFLIGAVRTEHWIMLGDAQARPRPVDQDYTDHLLALAALTRADATTPQDPEPVPLSAPVPEPETPEEPETPPSQDIDPPGPPTEVDHDPAPASIWYPAAGTTDSPGATTPLSTGRNNTTEFALPAWATKPGPPQIPTEHATPPTDETTPETTDPTTGEPSSPSTPQTSDLTPEATAPQPGGDVTVRDLPSLRVAAARRVEVAAGMVVARWAVAGEGEVLAEARRLLDTGLWERRYRAAYAKVLERLERDGDPDPEETLVAAAVGGRSLFARVAQAAPGLFHPAGSWEG